MMITNDPRWNDLAKVLVDYSTETAASDRVLIIMREPEVFPLVRAVSARCAEIGAYSQVLFYSILLEKDLMQKGNDDQAAWVPELWEYAMNWADVCIDLRGARNLYDYRDISAERISVHRQAEGRISALRTSGTRWALTRVPNEAFAQQAGRGTDEVMDFYFRAVLQDWEQESKRLQQSVEKLNGTSRVRIVGRGTDLSFSTAGRKYIVEDGHYNVPGGEIYTSPVEDSVEGFISFENPGVFAGVMMEEIRVEFEQGRVVNATSRTGEDFLKRLLDMDAGARGVGEFGIGTNRNIDFFCNDILYDEKIYGTVHIALGRSYKECGGLNESALHWDVIKDLREEGQVYVDDKLILDRGELLI